MLPGTGNPQRKVGLKLSWRLFSDFCPFQAYLKENGILRVTLRAEHYFQNQDQKKANCRFSQRSVKVHVVHYFGITIISGGSSG